MRAIRWLATGGGLLWVTAGLAAEPAVSNRPALPGEAGYRPADGSVSPLNPPSFVWLHETNAQSYAVQWSRQKDFADPTTAAGFPWNTYTHSAALPAGRWFWRYRFVTGDGSTSSWSAAREVRVPAEATVFPMPTRAQQRARVPGDHPRLFLRPEELPRLRAFSQGPGGGAFAALLAEADRVIAAGPTPEPAHLGSARDKGNHELIRYWWPNREQTMKACQEAEVIAFVYLLTGEKKYAEAARQWVRHLAAWDPDGPTNFRLNCEAAKPMLYRLPRAYDWAYAALTDEDRAAVRRIMLRRATDAWESGEVGRGTGHLNRPYSSHGNRTWHKLGECALAFLGEIPEAETWLDYAVNKFHALYPVWSDDDGGWHEGVSYWGGYMSKAVWWLQAAQSALEIDGLKKPFFDQVGDFPLYLAPPGSPNMGFGDLSFRPPPAGWGGFLEYFVRAKGARSDQAAYWRWWLEQWGMKGETGVLGFLYRANLPPLPEGKAPVDLPVSKVFRGIGVASLHTSLLSSADDVHFLFKSSPFGTQSHGHNPHNSFQLNAFGEPLLTTCVYRDLHGSRFHYQWAHSTVAHNAVLVNQQGQIPHTPAPHGRIVDFKLTADWDYLIGDATAAYGDRLRRYLRHVLFLKPDLIVIYDELEAAAPATFQFMLHAPRPFSLDEAQAALVIEQTRAGASIRYLSPQRLEFRQWDGYEPKPAREFPNQWHLEAGTTAPARQLGMLTVIVPYRAGARPDWAVERVESQSAAGARIRRGDRTVLIGFAKAGAGDPAALEGTRFTERVLVQ